MTSTAVTVTEVMALKPCSDYPRDRIVALCGGESLPLAKLAAVLAPLPRSDALAPLPRSDALAPLPRSDARWLVTRLLLARRGRVALVSWALDCAERSVEKISDEWTQGVALACIQTTRAWREGKATIEEVHAAADAAAYAAAYAAATAYAYADDDAAYAAAYAAATAYAYADDDAAYADDDAVDAADAAAAYSYAAAADAAADAADAEHRWQIERAIAYLEQSE